MVGVSWAQGSKQEEKKSEAFQKVAVNWISVFLPNSVPSATLATTDEML